MAESDRPLPRVPDLEEDHFTHVDRKKGSYNTTHKRTTGSLTFRTVGVDFVSALVSPPLPVAGVGGEAAFEARSRKRLHHQRLVNLAERHQAQSILDGKINSD